MKNFLKKVSVVSLALAMMFTSVSCSSSSNNEEGSNVSGTYKIGLSVSTQNNPFFIDLVNGAKTKAEFEGVELIVVDAGDDVAKQTNDIEDLISKKVSVLIINPVDSEAVAPAVTDAKNAGIKVVSVDRSVIGATVHSEISSDNVEGATLAAEYILSLIGEGGEVAEIEGIPGASATIARGKGFHNIADTKLNVVSKQSANFNRAEGLNVMENMLQANPDIKAVFAHNDEMALGAIEAVGDKNIKVVGFDATDDAIAAIEAGTMLATVAQQPSLMGEKAVETALALAKGESVEASIPVEVTLVTKQ